MTPTQLKDWRKALSLNQWEAALRLGCGRRSLQQWEADLHDIPLYIELACAELKRRAKKGKRRKGPFPRTWSS
jgi:DNA-binding XRE family transcriptional regulator